MVNVFIVEEIVKAQTVNNDKDDFGFGFKPCCGIILGEGVERTGVMKLELSLV